MTTKSTETVNHPEGLAAFAGVMPGPLALAWGEYVLDAMQRSTLFLDVMRQRGDEEVEITGRPLANVLSFDYETVMSGRDQTRPFNYELLRILPPEGVTTDPAMRPVVVIDPRAGQGAGIGGFKFASEIGDALTAGHPVYFIGFSALPVPGQEFLDVVEGQVAFFERIVALHPDAPRPAAIGNCQAGYQTLMVAMLRPDLFGPCLVVGSPMSYWQGRHGGPTMRYMGGLTGGSWATALAGDIGHGSFDGSWLILNFDRLNLANFVWDKQYQVYAGVDDGAAHYLDFEKWWGDFITMNAGEMQYLVDNLFVGDRLMRDEMTARDGTVFDVRNVTSPIVVLTSEADTISPPPQTLGWILDTWHSEAEIKADGKVVVYCMVENAGHLALFLATKVAKREDEELVEHLEVIEALEPGLYEMLITPKPGESGPMRARFEPRKLDAIRAIGRNSPEDDRAFEAAERVSERNLELYRAFVQPWMQLAFPPLVAEAVRGVNPLRMSYRIFSERNPAMIPVALAAAMTRASRHRVAPDNPFLALQEQMSHRISTALDQFTRSRDAMVENTFFSIFGAPWVQAALGMTAGEAVHPRPSELPPAPKAETARKVA